MRPVHPDDALTVSGFSKNGWVVDGRLYPGALLIAPARAWSLKPVAVDALGDAHVSLLDALDQRPSLLLLGTGETMLRASPTFVEAARSHGLSVETMDSRAAARTYNVLVAEQRSVAALLL